MSHTDEAQTHRRLLFSIAYRMLGSVGEAEDAVQETFLRWHRVQAEGTVVESPKAWLSTVVTRICLDQIRSARVRREAYVGPWLPEPLVDAADPEPGPGDRVALAESLSTAFLVLLETLSPKERAAFLLHDVFAYGYAEVAEIVGESEAYCRQLARRARARLAERRPRFPASPAERERLTERFLRACLEGDMAALLATLAEDVTVWSDGGGKVLAARKPVVGREKVARFLLGLMKLAPPDTTFRSAPVNGRLGLVVAVAGRSVEVLSFEVDGGAIRGIYAVVNPDKLRAVPAFVG